MLTHLPRPHAVWFKHSFTSEDRRTRGELFRGVLSCTGTILPSESDQVTRVIQQLQGWSAADFCFIYSFLAEGGEGGVTFQVHVFSCSFQINLCLSSLNGKRSEINMLLM